MPAPGSVVGRPAELAWARDLVLNLTHAELTVRYRSTTLGFLWFVINPVVMMTILTIVFQHVVRLDIEHYPVFVFSALLPWTFFQLGLGSATVSVSGRPALVKRVRIPRVFLPLAAVGAHLVHFLVSLTILFGMMAVLGLPVAGYLLVLPPAVLLQMLCLVGFSLLTSSLNVVYRDIEHLTSVALRVWFYLTPTFYPLSYVPATWRDLFLLNPMAGIVEIHREAVIHGRLPAPRVIAMATLTSLVVLVVGATVFRHLEPSFDDHL